MTAGRYPAPTKTFALPQVTTNNPPDWPFPESTLTEFRESFWAQVWRKPQATAWHGNGYEEAVARYVVVTEKVMFYSSSAAEYAELRQIEDRLGLNASSMTRYGWYIKQPESEPKDIVLSTMEDPSAAMTASGEIDDIPNGVW